MSEAVSERPWSAYSESDYTLEQWHNACLLHLHTGPPTSKSQCKLPVKTPNGVLNRNGVHAAAAAMGGARSPLQAPAAQKAKAARALRACYNQLGEDAPPSLATMMQSAIDDILEHHGVKGMKWGVRKAFDLGFGVDTAGPRPKRSGRVTVSDTRKKIKTSGGHGLPAHSDAVRARTIGQKGKSSGLKALSNEELSAYSQRLNLEANVKRLNYANSSPAKKFALTILGQTGKNQVSTLANDVASTQVKKHIARHLVTAGALAAA